MVEQDSQAFESPKTHPPSGADEDAGRPGFSSQERYGLRISWTWALVAAFWLLASGVSYAKTREKLPVQYRQWLDRDAAYIITKEEKQAFLQLTTDEDRDRFIERFWEIRNPTPGAPTNSFKEEHYRRLAYADQHLGDASGGEGWRTDRGRAYITLGAPQQRGFYNANSNLRPFEIWFYSSPIPGLPPFFYLLFFQPGVGEGYRFYSPYLDGPEKLVTDMRVINDRAGALHVVDQSAGREVARTTLSLLPDEPLDFDAATSSLQSDVLLSHIRNLADDPTTKMNLERQRQILENVTSRLVLGGEFLDVLTVPLRDSTGNIFLHYVLRLKKPEEFAVGKGKDGRYYYSILVSAKVLGPNNQPIFTQEKKVIRYVDDAQFYQVKDRVFGYEGRLPLAPGKYKIDFALTNVLKQTSYRVEENVLVPEAPKGGIHLTPLVPFSDIDLLKAAAPGPIPFSAAKVKFNPLVGQELYLPPGGNLKFFYQIWASPENPAAYRGKKLLVDYAYGRLGMRGDSRAIHEEVQSEQFDRSGSLVSGKTIPLGDLPPGTYLLTVNLTDPETRKTASSTLNFKVQPEASPLPAWDIYDEDAADGSQKGLSDYQRGLCYLATGEKENALEWFHRALEEDPGNQQVRAELEAISKPGSMP